MTEGEGGRPGSRRGFRPGGATFAIYLVALTGITLLASSGSAEPLLELVGSFPLGDLVGHFILMGGLALTGVAAFVSGARGVDRHRRWWLVVLGVLALVTLDELLQKLTSTRQYSLLDLGASYAGVVGFSVGWRVLTEGSSPRWAR